LKDRTSKRPAILVTMPYLTLGGAEATVSQICRQLHGRGFRIFLVTTEPVMESQGDTSDWFAESVEEVYHLPRSLDRMSIWPEFVCSLIRWEEVEILWQVGSSFIYSLLPRLRASFPELAVVDLLFNPVGHTENHLRYGTFIDHVVVEHEGMRDWLVEHRVPATNVSVIPNAIDLDLYAPRPHRGDRFVVAFLGRLSEEKGPDVFLEIAAELAEDAGMEFLVCGTGPMESALRDLARRKGLEGRVRFLGRVSTQEFLPSCGVVVVSSRLDGRPNVVLESLAMGIPVVASRVGGIPALLPADYDSAICESDDVAAFARAIRELADDKERWNRYSAAARKHAEEHFSIAHVGAAYTDLFDRLRSRRLRVQASRRAAGTFASMLQRLKIPPKNAYLLWRVYRSSAWGEVLQNFDQAYYAKMNPAVQKWGMPALLHYIFFGAHKGSDPSPQFQTYSYLSANPDVARLGLNPLLHYVAFGREEGRGGGPVEETRA
jgi:O-antigen biosynthesis protein